MVAEDLLDELPLADLDKAAVLHHIVRESLLCSRIWSLKAPGIQFVFIKTFHLGILG